MGGSVRHVLNYHSTVLQPVSAVFASLTAVTCRILSEAANKQQLANRNTGSVANDVDFTDGSGTLGRKGRGRWKLPPDMPQTHLFKTIDLSLVDRELAI